MLEADPSQPMDPLGRTIQAGFVVVPDPVVVRLLKRVAKYLGIVASAGIVAMMILTVIDVTRRKLGIGSISGAYEATEVGLVAVVFAGMMSAESSGAHVRTSLLTSRLSIRAAMAMRLTGSCIVSVFLVWLGYWTWDAGLASMRMGERPFRGSGVPLWPSKILIALGFSGMALQYMAHAAVTASSFWTRRVVRSGPATDPGSVL